jgi:hypothetical protein
MEYKELRKVDVSKYTEKKNGLTYLSWAWAVDQLLLADPKAHWFYPEFQRWGNGSVMVFCTVIANDIARTAQLPVMDYRNKPIPEPDSFAVNTAMQRCLAKAIALHGIGLYIYNGEDLPPDTVEEADITSKVIPAKVEPKTVPQISGQKGGWNITVAETEDKAAWLESLKAGCNVLLEFATKADDVANIFKINRVVFDKAKSLDEKFYSDMMSNFTKRKKELIKE